MDKGEKLSRVEIEKTENGFWVRRAGYLGHAPRMLETFQKTLPDALAKAQHWLAEEECACVSVQGFDKLFEQPEGQLDS